MLFFAIAAGSGVFFSSPSALFFRDGANINHGISTHYQIEVCDFLFCSPMVVRDVTVLGKFFQCHAIAR